MTMENDGPVKSLPGSPTQYEGAWIPSSELPLQRIYFNEREHGSRSFLTQPLRGGTVREWDWSAAVGEARRIAAYITAQNWPPGSRIVILSKNCAWWIMADFAIWMAGHVSVPIFPSLRENALASILIHSQPVACFIGLLERPPEVDDPPLKLLHRIAFPGAPPTAGTIGWEEILRQQPPLAENPVREALEIATIIYTSGTTGEPKGVMQNFQSLALMAKSMMPTVNSDGSLDRILSYLPLAHVAERAIVELNCLYMPFHIFFAESQETFLNDLARARPTIFFTVPRLLIRFQQGVWEKLPQKKLARLLRLPLVGALVRRRILKTLALDKVRLAASGSAPLPVDLLDWYLRLGLNLVEGYGMTETGITHVPLPGKVRPGYVGHASQYADTRISGEGEIEIKGPMNLSGYYRNLPLSNACFTEDGYFRTGDRGEIDAEGRLRIIGRLKEEFKTSKGKYVIPAPIEQKLSACGLFEAVCVLGAGMTGPFAAVVPVAEKRAMSKTPEMRALLEHQLEQELQHVNHELEHHEQLRFLVIALEPWTIENGLVTPTMKVRRSQVEDWLTSSFEDWEKSGKNVIWLNA